MGILAFFLIKVKAWREEMNEMSVWSHYNLKIKNNNKEDCNIISLVIKKNFQKIKQKLIVNFSAMKMFCTFSLQFYATCENCSMYQVGLKLLVLLMQIFLSFFFLISQITYGDSYPIYIKNSRRWTPENQIALLKMGYRSKQRILN